MDYEFIKVSQKERGHTQLILNRASKHNAFNAQFIEEITHFFQSAQKDELLRLVSITAEGKSFCAGADLHWMKSMVDYDLEQNKKDSQKLRDMFESIYQCPVPVLAKVQGYALGGGTGIVACCDFVLAQDNAKFGFTEVKLGLIPSVISPYVMEKIGVSQSKAWFLSGTMFDASRALQMNLVHEVTDIEKIDLLFKELVDQFLVAAPMATRECKKLIAENIKGKDIASYTVQKISELRVGAEGQEGMKSLLEKKKASWM